MKDEFREEEKLQGALDAMRKIRALEQAGREAHEIAARFAVFVKRPPWYRRAWNWAKGFWKRKAVK
jgi:hypothetical protein